MITSAAGTVVRPDGTRNFGAMWTLGDNKLTIRVNHEAPVETFAVIAMGPDSRNTWWVQTAEGGWMVQNPSGCRSCGQGRAL